MPQWTFWLAPEPAAESDKSADAAGWFSWFRGDSAAPTGPFSETPESEDELRAARVTIESGKGDSHYAYHMNDSQLAVSGTSSASHPVACLRPPQFPHEALEAALPTEPNAATVFPSLDSCLRPITWRTRVRLYGEKAINSGGERHVYRCSAALVALKRRRRRCLVISMHTFLPTKFVRLFLGQNTGNALTLAEKAAEAAKQWFGPDTVVESIALEGVGTAAERVAASIALLQNWGHLLSECDFIYVAAHGAAAVAAVELVAAMRRRFQPKKIALLVIAGFHLGAYPDLALRVVIRAYTAAENAVINDILDLARPCEASQKYRDTLGELCLANVKITFAALLSDQVVPLHLALCTGVRHANTFRCVYDVGLPDFIAQLFEVVMAMANVGCLDLALARDLGERLQGAVGALGGHSRFPDSVFEVGLRFALETTTPVHAAPARVDRLRGADRNLYHLPWNVRGLVNDLLHVKHIDNVGRLEALSALYRAWEPAVRAWREIKFCFAAFDDLSIDELVL